MNGIKNNLLLHRSIKILDLLSAEGDLRFGQLQKRLDDINPGTLTRLLKALCEAGVIMKNPDSVYCLTNRVLQWAAGVSPERNLVEQALPLMKEMNMKLSATVCLFNCDGKNMKCLANVQDPSSPSLLPTGTVAPLTIQLIGSVFFIFNERKPAPKKIKQELKKSTSPISISAGKRIIEHALKNGYCDDNAEFFPGNRRLSAPIRRNNKTISIIGLGFSSSRLENKALHKKAVALLLDTTEMLTS